MPLPFLVPSAAPADFDVQGTAFSNDVVGRYVCNNWPEVGAGQAAGGYPFDAVVIGAGMFGGYCAEKLFRLGTAQALRILVIDAGTYLLPSHIQNLPKQLGGKVGGADNLRNNDTGTQNVVWGMPWVSNEGFPGLAYCIGGRSLFWGGWSPRLTAADLASWPAAIRDSFTVVPPGGDSEYGVTEKEIGVDPSTDYIVKANLFNALLGAFTAVPTPGVTEVTEAPLAVQGSSPGSGLFAFDKFSSAPFLVDAIRTDSAVNGHHGDVSRRIFLLPRTQVLRLDTTGTTVTSLAVVTDGQPQTLPIPTGCPVVIANGTVEATRLVLSSFPIGNNTFGSPRVGNLMAHLRSNITVRIKRSALGLGPPSPTELETVALIVRGTALGRRFHLQVTAAAVAVPNPEANMWSMVPDFDQLETLLRNQDPNWIVITLRGIGEMQDQRSLAPNPAMSWVDLSPETDRWGVRRAYVNLVATAQDRQLWSAMDQAAFKLAANAAQSPTNIQYWNGSAWQDQQPQPDAQGRGFWQDRLGTTHHEAGTLFMGDSPASSITDLEGKIRGTDNAYVAGPAVFPTLGSANPSLAALTLARRTARAIIQAKTPPPPAAPFQPLSLDPKDWQMVQLPTTPNTAMIHYGSVLETFDAYGLYFYTKEQFTNFVLKLQWRVARLDDNSGVYVRTPGPGVAGALQAADSQGHEIQIDEIGFDSQTNTGGHPEKRTGAIYNLQAPSSFPSRPVGQWNAYAIEANGTRIRVTLNGVLVNDFVSNRRATGFLALQAHHFTSRVQLRDLQIQKLP